VVLVALAQVEKAQIKVASTLGYGKIWGWLIAVFPKIYKQIRLPIYAVIAFATSVVDIALILGPGSPPTLGVRILRLMSEADLSMRLIGSSAAVVQLFLTIFALFTWWLGERIFTYFGKALVLKGFRFQKDFWLRFIGLIGVSGAIILIFLGLLLLALWSVSFIWIFPDIFPKSFTFSAWIKQSSNIFEVSLRAINIAFFSSFIALILVVLALQNEYLRQIRISKFAAIILYLPLLLPQISFLFGLSVYLLWIGLDANIFAVIFVHIIFVLPYVYLLLVDAWHGFDIRLLNLAAMFGKSENKILFSVRLPILLRPILMAFSLGFAISIAQYLPTLLIGAGRTPTITTEAVALASGGNRRLIGVYAFVQTLLPFVIFSFAAIIPAIIFRNRKGLK
jgi:putative thiamine transport system permease protein